ncbi:hypothetical protein BH11PLA2_BH11PLA2_21820 [soil metagenome]
MMPGAFVHKYWRHAFLLTVALLVLVTGVKASLKVLKPGRTGEQTRTAFLRWRPQIEALHRGENIYRSYAYPNPPIMALVLTPFEALPPMTGVAVWFLAKVGMAVLMVLWTRRLIGVDLVPMTALCVAVALSLHPILGDLSHGNVNLFIAFLIFAGLECYRRGYDVATGLLMALAICCKVTPALFVPYFIWKRSLRTLGGIAAGMALWWFVVPGSILGFGFNTTLITSWYETMVKPFAVDGFVTSEHPNQSLPGVLTRLLTDHASFVDYAEGDGHQFTTETHTIINLGPKTVAMLVKFAMLGFGLVFLFRTTGRNDTPRQGIPFAAECGCVLLGMLLFSERTWKHHAVTLILPLAVLCTAYVRGVGRRRLIAAILVAVSLLSLLPSMLPEREQDLMMVYGTYTATYSLLLLGLFTLLKRSRGQSLKQEWFVRLPMKMMRTIKI